MSSGVIHHVKHCLAPKLEDAGNNSLPWCFIQIHDHDLRALFGEQQRGFFADTARRARNQCHFAL